MTETTALAEIRASSLSIEKSSLLKRHFSSFCPLWETSRAVNSSSRSVRIATRYSTAPFPRFSAGPSSEPPASSSFPSCRRLGSRTSTGTEGSSVWPSTTNPDHLASFPLATATGQARYSGPHPGPTRPVGGRSTGASAAPVPRTPMGEAPWMLRSRKRSRSVFCSSVGC